jgi:cell fate regulator YaaT (PSP1 superfamily)
MPHLIEVAFKGNRREFFLWEGDEPPRMLAPVIVEADRGEDLGRVGSVGELAERRCSGCAHGCGTERPTRKALRAATADEERRAAELRAQDDEARRKAMDKVRAHGLVMKVSDAEWQWDRRKLTLYFTADKRVDFRALVRDLAAVFRTRIELKQIGVRDEAKRLGGVGRCGREYCSASWLPDLRPVNLQIAKDQRLSLNPSQISGACGRLMCCLRYEHDFYVQARKRFPKEGRILVTVRGEEKVIANDIFRERVTLRSSEGDIRVVPIADLGRELRQPAPFAVDTDDEASHVPSADTQDEILPDDADVVSTPAPRQPSVEGAPRSGRRRGRRGGRRSRPNGNSPGSPPRE